MAAAHNSSSRHVSFITRFSILAEPGTQGWHMTRTITDMEQYRAALFSPARLNAKFQMFEKVTLPSVMAQTSRAFDWHIFTAEALPAPFLARLRTVTAPYATHITIHTVDGMKSFRSGVNEICEGLKARFGEIGFATSRLDDDDGVGPRIVERLSDPKYKPGTVVLFAKGKRFIMENGLPKDGRQEDRPPASTSSIIGGNIYACGNHKTLHERFPTEIDHTPDMFMLGCGDVCDTHRRA